MTIRFAAASRGYPRPVARALGAGRIGKAANDNGWDMSRNALLIDALRHFGEHGLASAKVARKNAEDAFLAGDEAGYRRWLEICRSFDRRMADATGF
ncbi:hypothetical protein GCM10011371_12410 [Novosphingobium marinum]|uniref:Uncharacterized protein n=1 Tax=Novosphingobium marinum TaxID=1514948 RepID=A0A7Y9XVQ4_9SPHN|nr:hypothetical protein [Novosphingobium marinum]NYH95350.1 hypothetical protein [Novosphingobium marinum]GGC26337.1 hypothetical protein GCM10011371_12410 [Novosphingobium marinum]